MRFSAVQGTLPGPQITSDPLGLAQSGSNLVAEMEKKSAAQSRAGAMFYYGVTTWRRAGARPSPIGAGPSSVGRATA